jgi:hypothetical protein
VTLSWQPPIINPAHHSDTLSYFIECVPDGLTEDQLDSLVPAPTSAMLPKHKRVRAAPAGLSASSSFSLSAPSMKHLLQTQSQSQLQSQSQGQGQVQGFPLSPTTATTTATATATGMTASGPAASTSMAGKGDDAFFTALGASSAASTAASTAAVAGGPLSSAQRYQQQAGAPFKLDYIYQKYTDIGHESVTFTNLYSACTYNLRVKSLSLAGWSRFSSPIQQFTLACVPDAPDPLEIYKVLSCKCCIIYLVTCRVFLPKLFCFFFFLHPSP